MGGRIAVLISSAGLSFAKVTPVTLSIEAPFSTINSVFAEEVLLTIVKPAGLHKQSLFHQSIRAEWIGMCLSGKVGLEIDQN